MHTHTTHAHAISNISTAHAHFLTVTAYPARPSYTGCFIFSVFYVLPSQGGINNTIVRGDCHSVIPLMHMNFSENHLDIVFGGPLKVIFLMFLCQ